jgi:hypothetical protein
VRSLMNAPDAVALTAAVERSAQTEALRGAADAGMPAEAWTRA